MRGDLLDALTHLDDLRGASLGMPLDPPALSPPVSVVVVRDVTEQHAGGRLVDDDAQVSVHA